MEIAIDRCKCCGYQFTSVEHRLLLNGNYEVIFCPHCQIGFTCLRPEQEIEREHSNRHLYNVIDRLDTYFGRKIEFSKRYEQCFRMMQAHSPIGSALDIGCNIGYWLHFLRKKGITDTVGIEINDECRRFGCEVFGLEVHNSMPDLGRTFGLISFFDVLEHLNDPISLLTQTFSLAHSGTIYFIQLPNYQSNMAKYLDKNWPWWSVPDHLWHFSPAGISKLLKRAGLTVVELKTCDTMYDLIEHVLPERLRPVMRPLRYIHRTSGYIYRRFGKGGLIQVLARKE
jgi:hypothetical protein